jgi:hypothetical protein
MPQPRYARSHRGRRAAGQHKHQQDRLGFLLMGIGGAIVLAFGGVAAFGASPQLDPTTGCPRERQAPPAHTIILVDETDSLTRDELRYARSLIQTEYLWLPIGGRMTIRNIIADPDAATDIVVCRMRAGDDVSGLTKNKRKVQRDFEQTAGAQLDKLYSDLAAAPPQSASPILEFISRTMERPDFGANIEQRRLIVLSDFAQYSGLASHYGVGRRFALDHDARSELERSMDGVAVRLQYISRPKLSDLQGPSHKTFWTRHLKRMGADVALGHTLLIGEDPTKETWIDES